MTNWETQSNFTANAHIVQMDKLRLFSAYEWSTIRTKSTILRSAYYNFALYQTHKYNARVCVSVLYMCPVYYLAKAELQTLLECALLLHGPDLNGIFFRLLPLRSVFKYFFHAEHNPSIIENWICNDFSSGCVPGLSLFLQLMLSTIPTVIISTQFNTFRKISLQRARAASNIRRK